MKRSLALAAAAILAISLVSCGSKNSSESKADAASSAAAAAESTAESKADAESTAAPESTPAADASQSKGGDAPAAETEKMTGGKLYFIPNEDGTAPAIGKIRIAGNRSGTEQFNAKDPSAEGIRCIFELNEYLSFYPESDQTSDMKVWFFKHKEDQSYYAKNKCSDLTPGFVQVSDLYKDPDAEEGAPWAETYLNPDECEPGLYDLVFTHSGKAFATMLARFVEDAGLSDKSDEELEKLQSEVAG